MPLDDIGPDPGPVATAPPDVFGNKLSATQLARAYGYDALHGIGLRGSGMTLGVIASASFRDAVRLQRGGWLGAHADPDRVLRVCGVRELSLCHGGGRASLGHINPLLDRDAAMRGAFRDLVKAGAGGCAAGPGYDTASGIGSPKAMELATVAP